MKNLKILRKNNGLSQKDLSDAVGISPQLISCYESGKASPSIESVIKLADYFGCSIDYLLDHNNINANAESLSLEKKKIIDLVKNLNAKDTALVLEIISKMCK